MPSVFHERTMGHVRLIHAVAWMASEADPLEEVRWDKTPSTKIKAASYQPMYKAMA